MRKKIVKIRFLFLFYTKKFNKKIGSGAISSRGGVAIMTIPLKNLLRLPLITENHKFFKWITLTCYVFRGFIGDHTQRIMGYGTLRLDQLLQTIAFTAH